jgi:hypothetical protein
VGASAAQQVKSECCCGVPSNARALDDDGDAARARRLLHAQRNLLREALLDLQPLGKAVDDARELGDADDAALRQVRDVHAAEEGPHVVLAHRVALDVAPEHLRQECAAEGEAGEGGPWGQRGAQSPRVRTPPRLRSRLRRARARPRTISRDSHSNSASATSARGDVSTPAVVASSALAMRAGVFAKPSRPTSSPRHSRMVLHAACRRSMFASRKEDISDADATFAGCACAPLAPLMACVIVEAYKFTRSLAHFVDTKRENKINRKKLALRSSRLRRLAGCASDNSAA